MAATTETFLAPRVVPVLSYAAPLPRPRRWLDVLLLIVALPTAVALFVPFTLGVPPVLVIYMCTQSLAHGELREEMLLGLLAAPFLLGLVLFVWHLRALIPVRIRTVETVVARSLALGCATMTIGMFGYVLFKAHDPGNVNEELAEAALGPGILAGGAMMLYWMRRRRQPSHLLTSICLQIAYLANATMCLVAFSRYRDPGWWITIVGSAGVAAVILIAMVRCVRRSGFDAN